MSHQQNALQNPLKFLIASKTNAPCVNLMLCGYDFQTSKCRQYLREIQNDYTYDLIRWYWVKNDQIHKMIRQICNQPGQAATDRQFSFR